MLTFLTTLYTLNIILSGNVNLFLLQSKLFKSFARMNTFNLVNVENKCPLFVKFVMVIILLSL